MAGRRNAKTQSLTDVSGWDRGKWQKKAFGVFRGDGTGLHTVRIRFNRDAARYVQESWWHDSQQFHLNRDGSVEMTLELTELTAITKWVLSFGSNATAIEPPELIDRIRDELQTMMDCYPATSKLSAD